MANEQNLTPVKKGQVLNPKGRGKGVPNTATRLRRLLTLTENLTNPITHEVEGFTVAEQLDLAQIIKARKGDTQAYNTIVDRLEGKAQQKVEHSGKVRIQPILGGSTALHSDNRDTQAIEAPKED